MTNIETLAEYREQKQKMEALAIQARKEMQDRYSALLTEAAGIQGEFKANFGANPELPATVKTFTVVVTVTPKSTEGTKIGGLRRSLAAAVKRQDGARIDELTNRLAEFGIGVKVTVDDGQTAE